MLLLGVVQTGEVVAGEGYDARKTIVYVEYALEAVVTLPPRMSRAVSRPRDLAA